MIERLRQQGITSAIFDPAANRPENGDYFAVMNANLGQLIAVPPIPIHQEIQ